MDEWLKNLVGEPSAWGAAVLYFLQRFIKNERTEVNEIKDDFKKMESRQDKHESKLISVAESLSELKGQIKR